MTLGRRATWIAVAVLTVAGLVLRLLAARGALWLDEAWSATFAQEARTPIGVFFRINHDNNHFLNTLWLQLVGPDAPPMLKRALSIACSTATIPLAALFAGRRTPAAAVLAALGFALSPIMVTYGAEARGYAGMMAATIVALLIADAWLVRPSRHAALWLALASLFGTLSQFLMIASLAAIVGWVFFEVRRQRGPAAALRETASLMGSAVACAALVLGMVALAAFDAPGGFEVGDYRAFAWHDWKAAIETAIGWTLGSGTVPVALVLVAALAVAALIALRRSDARAPFYAIAVLAYPLAFPLLKIGNAGMPRYYLLSMLALILLLADAAAPAVARAGWRRWSVIALALIAAGGSTVLDARIIANRRGDAAIAIAAMRQRAPMGTTAAVANGRMTPVLTFAARDAGYPLQVTEAKCADAPFLLVDGNADSADLPALRYCGRSYRRIAQAPVRGLSGTWWWLFERRR